MLQTMRCDPDIKNDIKNVGNKFTLILYCSDIAQLIELGLKF